MIIQFYSMNGEYYIFYIKTSLIPTKLIANLTQTIHSGFSRQIFDGHNGSTAAIYTRENLINNVLAAIPPNLTSEEWTAALPRALVAGFVKTDKDFQTKGIINGMSGLPVFLPLKSKLFLSGCAMFTGAITFAVYCGQHGFSLLYIMGSSDCFTVM